MGDEQVLTNRWVSAVNTKAESPPKKIESPPEDDQNLLFWVPSSCPEPAQNHLDNASHTPSTTGPYSPTAQLDDLANFATAFAECDAWAGATWEDRWRGGDLVRPNSVELVWWIRHGSWGGKQES